MTSLAVHRMTMEFSSDPQQYQASCQIIYQQIQKKFYTTAYTSTLKTPTPN